MTNVSIISKKKDLPITLIGQMGAGKSTIGRLLASRLSLPFYDSDREIEVFKKKFINEIFELEGETKFREYEFTVIEKLLSKNRSIIAVGGGAFINCYTRNIILNKSTSLWIKTDQNVIINRLINSKKRPLLEGVNVREKITELSDIRDPIYAKADIIIETNNTKPKMLIEQIINNLEIQFKE